MEKDFSSRSTGDLNLFFSLIDVVYLVVLVQINGVSIRTQRPILIKDEVSHSSFFCRLSSCFFNNLENTAWELHAGDF